MSKPRKNLQKNIHVFLLCIVSSFFTIGCGGGGGGGGNKGGGGGGTPFKQQLPPGTFKNSSTIQTQPNVVPLTAAESPVWDWPNRKLTIKNPDPKKGIKVGTVLAGDAAVGYSAKVKGILQSGTPLVLRIEPAWLPDIIASGDLAFTLTPDWTKATVGSSPSYFDLDDGVVGFEDHISQEPGPLGGPDIQGDGSFGFRNYSLVSLQIDKDGKLDTKNSSILGSSLKKFPRISDVLKRIKTDRIKPGYIRAQITKGLIKIVPTLRQSFEGFPIPKKASVNMVMTLKYSFQIDVEVSGSMHMEMLHDLFPKIKYPFLIPTPAGFPIAGDLELSFPATLILDASVKGHAKYSYTQERQFQVDLSYDRSQTPKFQPHSDSKVLSEEKNLDWQVQGKCTAELSFQPKLLLRFYKVVGPYLYLDSFIRGEFEFPWPPNQDDLFLGLGAGAGLELGNPSVKSVLGFKAFYDFRSPHLFDLAWSFNLFGSGGSKSQNSPPTALPLSLTLPPKGGVIQLRGKDPDQDRLVYRIENNPSGGYLGILDKTTGEIQYTPQSGHFGGDHFQYSVFDGKARSAPAKVKVVTTKGTKPVPSFSYWSNGPTLHVDASGTHDQETPSSQLLVRWDWTNDGEWDTNWTTTKTANHTYSSTGSYAVKLEVSDSDHMKNRTIEIVTVGSPINGKTITNSIGMKLNLIPAGSFLMGSPRTEKDRDNDEGPVHKVTLTKSFYLGQTEVTQGQWYAVMRTRPWKGRSYVKEGSDYPATYVSWNDAVAFCKALSKKEGVTYRLPTEAEWEYACRAGTRTRFFYGDDLSYRQLKNYAWYDKNAFYANEKYAHLVAQKRANPWGLFDTHGNVWEWCSDWYENSYQGKSQIDPKGPNSGSNRVFRGGGWNSFDRNCRSADRTRTGGGPGERNTSLGFRVARPFR